MTADLGDFFSLIGKAKKEKEDEFRSLVGELDIDSMFSQVKKSVKEEKKRKEKEARQAKALESWLFSETKKEEIVVEENIEKEIQIERQLEETVNETVDKEVVVEESVEEDDTIDHALKILETIKSKEEVQENVSDPEIAKIRRELEYLKNLVNAQGGGGEVRLKYLDDIVGVATNLNAYDGMYLGIDASNTNQPFVFSAVSGGGGSNYAISAGIATEAVSAGIATYATTAGIATYATSSGIATEAISAGIATYATTAGIATYATTAGIATLSQGLSGTPNINVGILTALSGEFSGNVTIGGTLTYEDVTNIDSVGLVTARSGVRIDSGGLVVTAGVSTLGVVTATNIYSTGIVTATSFVGDVTGNLSGDVNAGIVTSSSFVLDNGLISSISSTITTTLETSIDSFSATTYRSAKYVVQITRGTAYQSTEINIIHDGSDSYGTEYATIKTGSILATFSTDIFGGNVRLLTTPSSATSTTFKLVRTLIEV